VPFPGRPVFRQRDYPCENCEMRSMSCHSTCKKYLEAKETAERKQKEERRTERAEHDYNDYKYRTLDHIKSVRKWRV
jgi:hypothetical protein